jgi:hypothetical protein
MLVSFLGVALCVGDLERLPTIKKGQFADLKINDNGYRVWLSRMTKADYDGEPVPPFFPMVFEKLVNGNWVLCNPDGKVRFDYV